MEWRVTREHSRTVSVLMAPLRLDNHKFIDINMLIE